MALEFIESNEGKVLIVRATGKLSTEDYEQFVPKVEHLIERFGKIRVLFEMRDFSGWEAGALWEDIKFDARHFRDIERLALVGEKKWQKGMSQFCRAFTTADIKYFDLSEAPQAYEWIGAGVETPAQART